MLAPSQPFRVTVYVALSLAAIFLQASARAESAAAAAETKPGSEPATTAQAAESPPESFAYTLGLGVQRYPRWLGAKRQRTIPIPYVDLNWQDRIELSTTDGLRVDLVHGQHWHGGLVGTLTWGRSRHDLGSAASQLPTFDTTVQAGVYLEYAPIEPLSLGLRWRRDLQATGVVYGDLYAEWDLPRLGYVEHSIKGSVEGMNGRGMRRFFGLDAASAAALGQSPYAPGRGASQYTLEYQAFVPTSAHTGVALDFSWGKLASTARQSPVIQSYGAPVQRSVMAAFVVHY